MTEPGDGHFDRLAEGLSAEQRSEFFQTLHEAGITAHDLELARLLRVLQLYKAYYESILSAVQTAVADISRLKQEIAALSSAATQQAAAVSKIGGEVLVEAQLFQGQLKGIHLHVEAAIEKSAQTLATRMAALLHSRIDETVLAPLHQQLTDLVAANQALNPGYREEQNGHRRDAEACFHGTSDPPRWLRPGLARNRNRSCGSWLFIHSDYAQQMQRERLALVRDNEKNREVLLKLAQSGRTLELRQDPKRPRVHYVVMKDASGWESTQHHGVIESRE